MDRTFRFTVELSEHDDPPTAPMTVEEARETLDRALYEGYKHTRCLTRIVDEEAGVGE